MSSKMVPSIILLLAACTLFATISLAAPSSKPSSEEKRWGPPGSNYWGSGEWGGSWPDEHCPGKYPVGCTEETMYVRQDWQTMAPEARKAYTDAVQCLIDTPSALDPALYPAATSRFMDYAVIHVNRTLLVHLDAYFLTWHRYYVWLYEQDLRATCGYTGAQPYWNWPATIDDLQTSAVFDGSPYSMGSDGAYNDTGPIVLAPGFALPHGTGGGCVYSGPFSNLITPMADIPVSTILAGMGLPPTAFAYAPSCLTRDLNAFVAQTWTTPAELTMAIQAPDAAAFDLAMNGVIGSPSLGLHSGAHFTLGSPGSSLFVSPMDPVWYLLHAMLDNVFTSWQIANPAVATQLFGTQTALNIPPSPNATLADVEPDWGYFQPGPIQVGELMSTTAGPFCYRYDTVLS